MKESKLFYFLIGAAAILFYISNRIWPTHGAQLLDIVYTLVILAGVGMLIFLGTLRRSRYRMPVMLGAAGVITGLIFSLQSWKGADIILIAGAAAMLIFYSLHYFSKSPKTLVDHLKVIWLASAMAGLIFVIFNFPYAIVITDVVNILLLVILVIFLSSQPGNTFTPRKDKR